METTTLSTDPSLGELQKRYGDNTHDIGAVIDLIRRYSSLDRHGDALIVCRAAIKQHSRAYSFLLEFANVLYRNNDVGQARLIFKRLTELKPDRVEAWNNLGILELSTGNLENAREAFNAVLALEPENAGALCNIGNYFAEKGDAALAAEYFERALSSRDDFIEVWYNLGNAHVSLGNFKEAKHAFLKAISHCESFGSAYKNLGFACEQLEEYDDAIKYYRKAALLNKSDAGVQVNMAGVYMHKKWYNKALECGKRAVCLSPANAPSWEALRGAAMALEDGNSYCRAVTALIKTIDDNNLARSISDLRDMGFEQQAEELLGYAVKLNRTGISVNSLPFAESKAPTLQAENINRQLYKVINKRNTRATVVERGELVIDM